jgi:anti-sigma-K factor RskA
MSLETHDLVAAYALDALDDEERELFEKHLAVCAQCSAQLAELQSAAAALAYAVEGPEPPAGLRDRILDSARDEPRASVIRFPRRRALPAVAATAAVAACAAIALGIWANSLSNSLDRERKAKEAYERAAQLLAADATAKSLSGADGSLLVARDGRAAIVVCGLDRAPSGRTYEAWVIRGQTPARAGLFAGGGRCQPFVLSRVVARGSTVAVTLERAGGVDKPTTPVLFSAPAA